MDNLVSGKRFRSLLDEVAADNVGLRPLFASDGTGPYLSSLGPAVGADKSPYPKVSMLGVPVGADT
jgi:hypothetical protein